MFLPMFSFSFIFLHFSDLYQKFDEIALMLENLDEKTKMLKDFVRVSQLESERKVLLRKLTDTRIRIRNIEKYRFNRRQATSTSTPATATTKMTKMNTRFCDISTICDGNNNNDNNCDGYVRKLTFDDEDDTNHDEAWTIYNGVTDEKTDVVDEKVNNSVFDQTIDYEDEYFDPTETNHVHKRPVHQEYPTVALPHAKMFFIIEQRRVGKKSLTRDLGYNQTLHDSDGQFRSVEEEQVEADWDKMMTRIPPLTRSNHHVRLDKQWHCNIKKSKDLINNNDVANVKEPSKLESSTSCSSSSDCICRRKPVMIGCSNNDCGYTFTGRLSAKCLIHPGDQYLMDHSPVCPNCGNDLGKFILAHQSINEIFFS